MFQQSKISEQFIPISRRETNRYLKVSDLARKSKTQSGRMDCQVAIHFKST